MFKATLLTFTLLCVFQAFAQVTDSFDDGDFSTSPSWNPSTISGTDDWQISGALELQTNGPTTMGNAQIYITTANAIDLSNNTVQWELKVEYTISDDGSSSNFARVYLVADATDLTDDPNGYYVQLGESGSNDGIDLFKTSSSTAIITDDDDLISSGIEVSLRITRTSSGFWTLEADAAGGSSYSEIGTATDTDFTTTSHFGLLVAHSSGRSDAFLFDDINISITPVADTTPPELSTVAASSATTIAVDFNEDVEETTAENASNYEIDGVTITSAVRDATDNSLVTLTVTTLTNGENYDLVVNNVDDLSANSIATDASLSFQYLVLSTPAARDIVINEFSVDPSPPVSLPEVEFVELYNPTSNYYDLADFVIEEETSSGGVSTSGTMSSHVLAPEAFVLIVDEDDVASFTSYGDVVGVSSLPDFNLTNSSVILKDGADNELDRIDYGSDTPRDGITFEQINPSLPCTGEFNFSSSTHADGGTPGSENSVFDDTPDTAAPTFSSLEVIDTDSLHVSFSEFLEESEVSAGDFSLDGFTITEVVLIEDNAVALLLNTGLVSETTYALEFSGLQDCSGNVLTASSETFYYDVTAPSLNSLLVASDNAVFLIFNEPLDESSSETESNFVLDQAIGEPSTNILQDSAAYRLLVTFASSFSIGTTYTLTFSNVEDTSGNASSATMVEFTFQDQIDSARVVAANVLEVEFSEDVDENSSTSTFNYFHEDLGNPSSILSQDASTVRLVFENNFDENAESLLYVANILSEDESATLQTPAVSFEYDTRAPSLTSSGASGPTELTLEFDEALDSLSATNLSFYQLENEAYPIQASLEANVVRLTFANAFTEEVETDLSYSRIEDIFGNSSTKKTLSFTYDSLAPRLNAITQLNDTTISMLVSEPLDQDQLLASDFVVGSINPEEIEILGPDSTELNLIFEEALISDESMTYEILNWQDQSGNALTSSLAGTINTINANLALIKAESDTSILIIFSKSMGSTAFDASNYAFSSISISSLVQVDEVTAQILFHEQLIEGQSYSLETSGILDASGASLQADSAGFTFNTLLDELVVIDPQTLELHFNTEFSSLDASTFEVDGASVALATIDAADPAILRLILSAALEENQSVGFLWRDLEDRYLRELPDHYRQIEIDTQRPTIAAVASDFRDQLVVTFSEEVDQASLATGAQVTLVDLGTALDLAYLSESVAQVAFDDLIPGTEYELVIENFSDLAGNFQVADTVVFTYSPPAIAPAGSIVITEIMIDPAPAVGQPTSEYLEIYNLSTVDYNLKSLYLSKSNDEVRLPDTILSSGSYIAFVEAGEEDAFGNAMVGIDGLISFSNDEDSIVLRNIDEEVVDQVVYTSSWYGDTSKDDGGYSLEKINPGSSCVGPVNWLASQDVTGGTPGVVNSVFSLTADQESPSVSGVVLIGNDTVQLTFSEELDPATINSSNITVPIGTDAVIISDDRSVANVILSTPVVQGVSHQLSLSGLTDCAGNVLGDTSVLFGLGQLASTGDLLITEIMADPDPVVGLPNSEYIEIYNTTANLVSLEELRISDGSGLSQAIGGVIFPGTYLVLVPTTSVNQFTSISVQGISSWPSLNNSGETVSIVDSDTVILVQVAYEQSWYADDEKEDGGYSLEMIFLGSDCSGISNWSASTNESGGTPGTQNAVFSEVPESEPPTIETSTVVASSLEVIFSEEMNATSLTDTSFVVNGLIVDSVAIGEDRRQVQVFFTSPILTGTIYPMVVSGPQDCSGNSMVDVSLEFGAGTTPVSGEIRMSEIMADPQPQVGLPASEYLEVYNNSDKLISLANVRIADENNMSSPLTGVMAPWSYKLLVPSGTTADFGDASVIEVAGWSALANTGERLALVDADENVLDQVTYSVDWFSDVDKREGGYSLEIIDFESACTGAANWTGSLAAAGGTPGKVNSVFGRATETNPPQVYFGGVESANSIRVTFSEEMNAGTLTDTSFEVADLTVGSIDVSVDRMSAKIFFESDLQEDQLYELQVIGPEDCSGNGLVSTMLTFGIGATPTFGDIVITEIMADPDPGNGLPATEYLEIYNRTDKLLRIDQVRWTDGNSSSGAFPGIILPGEFLLVVPSAAVEDFLGINPVPISPWPGLNNAGEKIALVANDELIFEISYEVDWHDAEKQDGGYSLEMRDPDNLCGGDQNWGSSTNELGGTPGTRNSIAMAIPDNLGPNLLAARAVTADSVVLQFDEPLHPLNLIEVSISNDIAILDTTLTVNSQFLSFQVATNLQQGFEYQVSVPLAQDCLGNFIRQSTTSLILPFPPELDDILLSEILFNPRTDGFDFVELFNASGDFVELNGLEIGNANEDNILLGPYILEPSGYVAITQSKSSLQLFYPGTAEENVLEVTRLPSFPNNEGVVTIYKNDQRLDSLYYLDDFHNSLLEDVDGVSLERIAFDAPNSSENWTSAASVEGFATPGYANSQQMDLSAFVDPVQAEPKVFVPGSANSFTTINYEFETAGSFANIYLYDQNGRLVKTLGEGVLLNTDGFVTWDGSSNGGSVARAGYYVIVFEVFGNSGAAEIFKETVVVGRDF